MNQRFIQAQKRCAMPAAVLCCLALVASLAACSSESRKGDRARAVTPASAIIGSDGGTVGDTAGAHVRVPAGALDEDTEISLRSGAAIALPGNTSAAGPAVEASPDGLLFNRAATIGVPVDGALLTADTALADLMVFRQESSGEIAPVPVTGYDDVNLLLFAAIEGFTVFQAAVPDDEFVIVPRTSLLVMEGQTMTEIVLETSGAAVPVTFAIVQTSKVDGIESTDAEIAEDEIAPGVTFAANGTISGTPVERGTFAFAVSATDSSEEPQVATISLTLTVVASADLVMPDNASLNGLMFAYDDAGDLFALGEVGSALTLVKFPVDDPDTPVSLELGSGAMPAVAIAPDGSAVVVVYQVTIDGDPYNQQIFAAEFDGDLSPTGAAFRVDMDPVIDPEAPDETLTDYARQALRPGVAFAAGHDLDPDDDGSDDEEAPLLYCVAYEAVRNLGSDGSLRADVYAVWREFGGADAVSLELRLDATDDAGQSSGDAIAVSGNALGCIVLWTEQGGDNAGTNGTDDDGNPILGSPGEVMASMLTLPVFDEGADLPIVELAAPEATALNAEATTTGLHASVVTGYDNSFYAVWTERDDTPATASSSTSATAGRISESSAIFYRRPLRLRAAVLSGQSVGTNFLVNDAPIDASLYSASIAADVDGEIAVAWVSSFHDGTDGSFLRRFNAGGVALESSIEIGGGNAPLVAYSPEGVLSVGFRQGGDVQSFTLDPDPPEEETE